MVDLNIELPEGFLDEEIRCGYTVTRKMKEVWAVELDLVQRFIKACEKHGLKCYADAGTLLGTVRHKGFIPWDDDIDLVMFRQDYDKMVKIAPKEFEDPYFFQNWYSDKGYYRGHAQFRNSMTTAILNSEEKKNYKFNQGIFVDIFVLDAVDLNNIEKQKKKIEKLKKLNEVLLGINSTDSLKRKVAINLLKIVKYRHLNVCKQIDDGLRKVSIDKSEYVAPLNFIFETEKRIRNKHLYDDTVWLPFEFIELPAPCGYDEFLVRRYGDYMKPSQVPTSHAGVIFDTDKPYTEYLNME